MIDFRSWYTDLMEIWRDEPIKAGELTRKERVQVAEKVPCRMYHVGATAINMEQTAASISQTDWVQCANEVDIKPGDELLIHRGAALGHEIAPIRAFAGEPNHFFEPFGAVVPGLAHQEIRLLQEERA